MPGFRTSHVSLFDGLAWSMHGHPADLLARLSWGSLWPQYFHHWNLCCWGWGFMVCVLRTGSVWWWVLGLGAAEPLGSWCNIPRMEMRSEGHLGLLDHSSLLTFNFPPCTVVHHLPKRCFFFFFFCRHSDFLRYPLGKSGVSYGILGFPCTPVWFSSV